jgi:hypothetical protein
VLWWGIMFCFIFLRNVWILILIHSFELSFKLYKYTFQLVMQENVLTSQLQWVLIFLYSFIHMCIHFWTIFSPYPLPLPSPHQQPCFQAEPVSPLPLILLKRKHKQ